MGGARRGAAHQSGSEWGGWTERADDCECGCGCGCDRGLECGKEGKQRTVTRETRGVVAEIGDGGGSEAAAGRVKKPTAAQWQRRRGEGRGYAGGGRASASRGVAQPSAADASLPCKAWTMQSLQRRRQPRRHSRSRSSPPFPPPFLAVAAAPSLRLLACFAPLRLRRCLTVALLLCSALCHSLDETPLSGSSTVQLNR